MDSTSMTRRSALGALPTAGLVGAGLVGLYSTAKVRAADDAARGSEDLCDCTCTLSFAGLKREALSPAGENADRDLISALVGVAVPILVEEIVKAVRSRDVVRTSGARASAASLIEGHRGTSGNDCAVRGLFGGSVSAGVQIGVVIG